MTGVTLAALAAGGLLGFFNGANDVSKGVATLVGSGVSDYRRAIGWGTLCTALGGLAAILAGKAMVSTFGGGLLAPGIAPTAAAALATILGAGAWVLVATRTGLPVSTTHSIVGAISGAAIAAYGVSGMAWAALGRKIALPLVASPLAALAATALILATVRAVGRRKTPGTADCLCATVETPAPLVTLAASGGTAAAGEIACPVHLTVVVASREECDVALPDAKRIALDRAHWLTSGAASFARGLNDAPKLAALVLATAALSGAAAPWLSAFLAVTLGMIAGSLLAGRRITHVLAEKVTRLDHEEGFFANLVTAGLVGVGAVWGLPMSTTHVSTGAILGGGIVERRDAIRWGTVNTLVLAWVVTLPASAVLAAACYSLARLVL